MSLFAPRQLMTIPLELQLQILSHLSYPDMLSLKLTSRHFHQLAMESLTVVSRVTWLLERAQAKLVIPKSGNLRLHNDAVFLQNAEVQMILRARRRHEECALVWRELSAGEDWPGCLVVPGLRLCEKGVELLELSGGQKPVWTCDGRMAYISERMVRDWEDWRRRSRRAAPGTGVLARNWDVVLLRLRLAWEVWGRDTFCQVTALYAFLSVMVVIVAVRLASQEVTSWN